MTGDSALQRQGASVPTEQADRPVIVQLRAALRAQAEHLNFLSRLADGQRRCARGSGRATWATTIAAIRTEALAGEAAARKVLAETEAPEPNTSEQST